MRRLHSNERDDSTRQKLCDHISQMGERVASMIAGSVRALVARDSGLAHRMIELDQLVDRFEVETYDLSLALLARGNLAKSDLRFLTTGLKLVTDLERIGDVCVSICERAIELDGQTPLVACEDLFEMGAVAQEMVREVLQAFLDRDPAHARRVIERDRTIDACYAQLSSELLASSMQKSTDLYRTTRVHSVARCLERIGDDATSLAEMVVSMVKGARIGQRERVERAV